jgi:hypothetical protein
MSFTETPFAGSALCKAVRSAAEPLEELEAYYAPGHYSTLLY